MPAMIRTGRPPSDALAVIERLQLDDGAETRR
jgi:hypothetical protein